MPSPLESLRPQQPGTRRNRGAGRNRRGAPRGRPDGAFHRRSARAGGQGEQGPGSRRPAQQSVPVPDRPRDHQPGPGGPAQGRWAFRSAHRRGGPGCIRSGQVRPPGPFGVPRGARPLGGTAPGDGRPAGGPGGAECGPGAGPATGECGRSGPRERPHHPSRGRCPPGKREARGG